jgi:hypothetical protein
LTAIVVEPRSSAAISNFAIHFLAASVASGSILSRTRSAGFAGASEARILDRIESASPKMAAVE